MIETIDSAQQQITQESTEGLKRWRFAYLQSNKHWFYVDYSNCKDQSVSGVMMLGTEEDLLLLNKNPEYKINHLYLVSPPEFNSSKRWKMEELNSVSNMTYDKSKNVLFELIDGSTYEYPKLKNHKKPRDSFSIYVKRPI